MPPDVTHFCTYFDHRYLARGLALIKSLEDHCPQFEIWVLCLDEMTYDTLSRLARPGVHMITLAELEQAYPELVTVKPHRTALEYYFTCTPSLPRFVLARHPAVELITYLDADIYFYHDPTPLFEELGTGSIAIVAHRRPPALQALTVQSGIYNVAWVGFRRDASGLACLHWWHERCIEWCYERSEDGKYGDQKYLDVWPARFDGVVVLNHKGADLARWNVANYQLTEGEDRQVYVDEQPLIFYHFNGFTQTRSWLFNPRFNNRVKSTTILRRRVYGQYVAALVQIDWQMKSAMTTLPLDDNAYHAMHQTEASGTPRQQKPSALRRLYRLIRAISTGRLLVSIRGRVL